MFQKQAIKCAFSLIIEVFILEVKKMCYCAEMQSINDVFIAASKKNYPNFHTSFFFNKNAN